jgi:hypothetical protein
MKLAQANLPTPSHAQRRGVASIWLWMARLLSWGILLFVFGCSTGTTTVKKTRVVGFKGKARMEPFLAAERLAFSQNWDAKTIMRLSQLPDGPGATLLLSANVSPGTIMRALKWREENRAHLILAFANTGSFQNDFAEEPPKANFFALEDSTHPALRKLGIRVKGQVSWAPNYQNTIFRIRGKKYVADFDQTLRFDCTGEGAMEVTTYCGNSPDNCLLASLTMLDGGKITLLADASPFRNKYIKEKDHAALFMGLLGLNFRNQDWLFILTRDAESFFELLWRKFTLPLTAMILLVVCWLWKSLPRFGPVTEVRDGVQRQFSEHMRMTGSFLLRHGQSAEMIEGTKRAIMAKIQKDHPRMLRWDDADLVPLLAERAQLPLEEAEEAWGVHYTKDPTVFTRAMHTLTQIYQCL